MVLIFVLGGCRHPRQGSGATLTPDEAAKKEFHSVEAQTLGSGDVLEVRVYQEPDISGAYRLSPDGTIDYPLCGKVQLLGKTASGAADSLIQCLSHGYLRHPQVTVMVREYNSKKIFVIGEVARPGTFPYDDNMNIIQAVTMAGGFTRTASKNATNVTRVIDGEQTKIRVPVDEIGQGREKNFALQPGDIIYVPESFL